MPNLSTVESGKIFDTLFETGAFVYPRDSGLFVEDTETTRSALEISGLSYKTEAFLRVYKDKNYNLKMLYVPDLFWDGMPGQVAFARRMIGQRWDDTNPYRVIRDTMSEVSPDEDKAPASLVSQYINSAASLYINPDENEESYKANAFLKTMLAYQIAVPDDKDVSKHFDAMYNDRSILSQDASVSDIVDAVSTEQLAFKGAILKAFKDECLGKTVDLPAQIREAISSYTPETRKPSLSEPACDFFIG